MKNEFVNGCKNPKTLKLIDRITKSPHSNTVMMFLDDEGKWMEKGAEVVVIGFILNGTDYVAYTNVETEHTDLYFRLSEYNEYYGSTTFNAVMTFIENTPHISSILNKFGH